MEKKLQLKYGALAAALALTLTGCWGGDDNDSPPESTPNAPAISQSPSSNSTESSEPEVSQTTSEPAAPAPEDFSDFSKSPQTSPDFPNDFITGSEPMYLTTARVGIHDGYDRIVFEHSGNGQLSYSVEYIDQPVADGSGLNVDVAGNAYLAVTVAGLGFTDESDFDKMFQGQVPGVGTQSNFVQEVHAMSQFEGQADYFIGLDEVRDFKVSILDDPVRVVVDIRQ